MKNKRTPFHYSRLLIIALLFVAGFFRLWRINELTEFLGDQGRTGMVIYDAWKNGIIPLAGPTVLSGQHLGPFFYYLIGPAFIIGGFNPVIPSAFIALLGIGSVYLLFRFASRLWGFWIGWATAMLLAIAAYILLTDRTIWEPSVIPLFVLLYLWCIYEVFELERYKYLLPMGVIVGILIQLHYPTIFFVGLSIGVVLLLLLTKKVSKKTVLSWSLAGVVGFFLVLSPFLLYEAQHAWIDIREMAIILVAGGAAGQPSLTYSQRMVHASSKLFGYLAPEVPRWVIIFLQLFTLVLAVFQTSFWPRFLATWYAFGIASIGLYRGVVFDHYLFFLLPLPYLLLAHATSFLRRYLPMGAVVVFVAPLILINVQKTDILSKGLNDISRVRWTVREVINSAKNQPFSFTLVTSRSFSDLHYRYFFKLAGVEPRQITDSTYRTLFLVCDQEPCPKPNQMQQKSSVQTLCFEPHCKGTYPTVDLSRWELKTTLYAPEGRIYMFWPSGVGG